MSIVLVVLEISKGKLISHSKECMTVAKNLADQMGGELNGVIIGHEISSLAEEATKYGLKKVYKADAPELKGINLLYHIRAISGEHRGCPGRDWLRSSLCRVLGARLCPRQPDWSAGTR